MGIDRPEEVDAAFDRGKALAGDVLTGFTDILTDHVTADRSSAPGDHYRRSAAILEVR
ncbi:MAG TPA: hypothetical protein VGP70_28975 [Actinomadura sp.]|nr:hypothetical protein [Actinomadura sp.]